MTKKELIEALAPYPDDMQVLCEGYKGGYDIPGISTGVVKIDHPKVWYQGEYTEVLFTRKLLPSDIKAILIYSVNRNTR